MPMPLEIVGLGKSEVRFVWDDDDEDVWSARDLRIRCTCALCQSELTGERILDPATVPEDLTVTHMALVGNYGLNVHFSDGHTTGIYRFVFLKENPPGKPDEGGEKASNGANGKAANGANGVSRSGISEGSGEGPGEA